MSIDYPFPLIRHIDDVLPHIDDQSFRIVEKDYGTFINYNMMGNDVFPAIYHGDSINVHEHGSAHRAAVRRECRGIMFDPKTGEIVSRPFHKFFNAGEREDIAISKLDLSQPHTVYEKLDGSMIRPIKVDGGIRLGTKMGITDVALLAEEFYAGRDNYEAFMRAMVGSGFTPIFEFVSRRARIVVDYAEENLILLAVRDNYTGEYLDAGSLAAIYEIPFVRTMASSNDMASLVETIRKQDTGEGVVVCWDGHKVKVKSEDYVRLHRAKDKMRTERNLVELILSEGLDDFLPMLSEEDATRVNAFNHEFHIEVGSVAGLVQNVYSGARRDYNTKRDFAVSGVLQDQPRLRSVVFALWDGKIENSFDAAIRIVRTGLASETKWREMKRVWNFQTSWDEASEECG